MPLYALNRDHHVNFTVLYGGLSWFGSGDIGTPLGSILPHSRNVSLAVKSRDLVILLNSVRTWLKFYGNGGTSPRSNCPNFFFFTRQGDHSILCPLCKHAFVVLMSRSFIPNLLTRIPHVSLAINLSCSVLSRNYLPLRPSIRRYPS